MSMKTLVFLIALLASTDARAQAPASDSGEGPPAAQAASAGADLLAQFSGAVEVAGGEPPGGEICAKR